ncbi:unnamed protein product [Choristocarpus tenellus]
MFLGGCFLLPWLWVVNLCFFGRKAVHPRAKLCELNKLRLGRSLIGVLLYCTLFTWWVITFQVMWTEWVWATDIMVVVPDAELTGW